MKIRVLSDLHFEFHRDGGAGFVRDLHAESDELLVLAGDIAVGNGLLPALQRFCAKWRHVLFVAGNHEYYRHRPDEVRQILHTACRISPNLHWLDNRAVTVGGQRFVGGTLWFGEEAGEQPARHFLSDFHAIEDFEPWVYGEHRRTVNLLLAEVRATDVVVTHHLPAHDCVADKWKSSPLNPFFVHDLRWLIEKRQPKLWIHGHTHEPVDVHIGNTRLVANPFGYLDHEVQPKFRPDWVVEV